MISGKAIVLSGGILDSLSAKTTHGLVRGSERFDVQAVIDPKFAGKMAHELIAEGKEGIPVVASVDEFINNGGKADYAIIGVASKGGVVPDNIYPYITTALENGISIINGLHQHLAYIPEFASLASQHGAELIDIRRPKLFGEARFWNGEIMEVKCPKIAVLGTDCALGKRTTSRFLTEHLKAEGYKAEMIYTGQTGWMQGAKYGFIFDATLNDFISGEIEGALLDCYRNENPDFMVIEGQSSLKNPSGPCGSEFIISARLDGVILQHHPTRVYYKDMEHYPETISAPVEEMELIQRLGSPTIGLSLNTAGIEREEAEGFRDKFSKELGIPVSLPLYDGVGAIADACKELSKKYQ